jgi:hypothetical protein
LKTDVGTVSLKIQGVEQLALNLKKEFMPIIRSLSPQNESIPTEKLPELTGLALFHLYGKR